MTWLLALVGLGVGGGLAQRLTELRDRKRFPAPGRLLRLADCDVHVVVEGSGPPVLFDSGLGGSSIEWARIAADLAPDFTVIRYDRPGFAWSPGSTCDRRATAAGTRIIEILEALDCEQPAILVGHSLGGVHVRVAAALAPDRVGGLVLVDPSHEDMLDVAADSKAATVVRTVVQVAALSAPLGGGRLAGRLFGRLALADRRQEPQPDDLERGRVAGLLTARTVHGLRALAAEHSCLEASLQQVKDMRPSIGELSMPVTVITGAAPSSNPRLAEARAQIDPLHAALVAACSRGRHVFAERSGHLVPLDQPDLIAECVREMAAELQTA